MEARWAANASQPERRGAVAWRRIRRITAGTFGLLWCWAVLRVAVHPAQTGPVEQGFAVSGWTLGLLPVHVTPWRGVGSGRGLGRVLRRGGVPGGTECAGTRPLPTPRRPGAYTPVGATAISVVGTEPRTRRPDQGR